MGISSRVFFLHSYRGRFACRHELLLRVHVPAYSNADQGAEDAAWAFGESAALHLRTWWERYELAAGVFARARAVARRRGVRGRRRVGRR